MKIGYFSDTHLEFRMSDKKFNTVIETINNTKDDCDLLINAGDTASSLAAREFFNEAVGAKSVLGNHDFYGHQIYSERWLDDSGDLRVLGCTLWTDFKKGDPAVRARYPFELVDAKYIRQKGPSLVTDILNIFKTDIEYIKTSKPDIVVTHHAPSRRSVHEKYLPFGDTNYYFVSDLEDFILDNPNIKLWIHGHVHTPFDYYIGNCRVVCNPLGYPNETYHNDADFAVRTVDI